VITTTRSFIDRTSVPSNEDYDNIDPSSGQALGLVARGGANEFDLVTILTRIGDLTERDRRRLAWTEREDCESRQAKPRTETPVAARYCRFYGCPVILNR
jgi:aldehyde dehydrogenase (NAD+)/betaine-aldehyde dehydrogenase